jgi:hypothetical protein
MNPHPGRPTPRPPLPTLLLAAVAAAPLLIPPLPAAEATTTTTLRIHAGNQARLASIVDLDHPLPADATTTAGAWELRSPDGHVRILQAHQGRARFIEANLPAGTSRDYAIKPLPTEPPGVLAASRPDDDLEIRQHNKTVLRYLAHHGRLPRTNIRDIFRRGGYLHPVVTPSGNVVTDDYPPNHIHHHGVWSAWTKTRFDGRTPDFWNMGEGRGRVDFHSLDDPFVGPVFAGFTARQRHIDTMVSPPVPVLEDTWRIFVTPIQPPDGPAIHLFDLHSEQRLLTGQALELPRYYYGGLGWRGPWPWNGPRNLLYLDSNGVTNRVTANGSRVRWFWTGGNVNGTLAGLAILSHPANFRAPQPVRVHPSEPFICWAPSHLGDWSIQPGDTVTSRYRFVVFDGPPDAALLEGLWRDYAEPPKAEMIAAAGTPP